MCKLINRGTFGDQKCYHKTEFICDAKKHEFYFVISAIFNSILYHKIKGGDTANAKLHQTQIISKTER